jgi:EmrB/QacA subfamily drug resistance transporter
MTSAPQTAFVDKPPIELPHPVRMRILFMVMIGVFLAALDQTVVGTALPKIITDLGGNDLYTWAFTAYLLTSTISGPLYGKLSDLFGRRPIFLFGIGIFMVGSLLAGLSQEMWHLIGARGIQGLGAGALFPIALAVIGDLFSPSERGRYQGLFGAVFGLSVLIGPAIGGLLTDTVGWPFVFFFNLPIGAVVFYVVWRNLPSYHLGGDKPVIDYVGAALFTAALVPILIGLTNKQSADWTDPIVGGLILVGLVIGIVFLVAEARAREPIVPLELFRIRSFSISVAAFFLASFGFLAAVVFLPRWFQVVNGSSATESGYQILPLLGRSDHLGDGGRPAGRTDGPVQGADLRALVTMAAGLWLLTNLRADTPIPLVWLWMFITGIGVGPSFAVFTLIVQNSVPIQRLGTATSNLTFFQSVGGTIGLAITGTIFGTTLAAEAPRQLVRRASRRSSPRPVAVNSMRRPRSAISARRSSPRSQKRSGPRSNRSSRRSSTRSIRPCRSRPRARSTWVWLRRCWRRSSSPGSRRSAWEPQSPSPIADTSGSGTTIRSRRPARNASCREGARWSAGGGSPGFVVSGSDGHSRDGTGDSGVQTREGPFVGNGDRLDQPRVGGERFGKYETPGEHRSDGGVFL